MGFRTMSSKPRHGDSVASSKSGERIYLSRQAQVFFDELERALKKIEDLEARIKALEDA